MSIKIRKAGERGRSQIDWLDSYHTFSFSNYYDEEHMGFADLRVINEDRVIGGAGFGTHGHRDMEIVTYVLEGALEHKDSTGKTGVILPGDVQRMTAGTGIQHSEYNGSEENPVHFLQIWVLPDENGLQPGYVQQQFEWKPNELQLILSKDGREDSLEIHQDINIYRAKIEKGQHIMHEVKDDRVAWVQMAKGNVIMDEYQLNDSDGASISEPMSLTLRAYDDSELLLFDMKA